MFEWKDSDREEAALSGRLMGIPADELHLAAAQGPKVCHGRKRCAPGGKKPPADGSGGADGQPFHQGDALKDDHPGFPKEA